MLTKIMFLVAVVAIGYQIYPSSKTPPTEVAPTEIFVGGRVANLPSGTFRVTNLVNYKNCRVEDDLTSACQERKLPAPDEVVLRLTDSAEGKTFELSSFCRQLYGHLRPTADDQLKVEIAAENDNCGGREVSLYHDRIFDRFEGARGLFVSAKKFKIASGQGEALALAWLPGREVASVSYPSR